MADKVYARPIDNGLWQWRVASGSEGWRTEEYFTGDNEALRAGLPSDSTPVHIILPGSDVVACEVGVSGIEKKHLAKMLPYELEDKIIDAVEDVHLAFGDIEDNKVAVQYIRSDLYNKYIEPMTSVGCEVTGSFPDYALLNVDPHTINVLYDGLGVYVTVGKEKSFTTDPQLAPILFERLEFDLDEITRLSLTAETQEQLEEVNGWIPEIWEEDLEIFLNEGSFWGSINPGESSNKLNLRTGSFARQLPFERWFHIWKVPTAAIGIAFLLSVVVMFGEYFTAKGDAKNIRKSITTVYLDAVPNGKRGDEEGRLRALLKTGNKKTVEPTNMMVLLSGTADVMRQMDSIKMVNFRYSGDQRELQVNIEVDNLSELNQFKEKLNAAGLKADSPRSNAQGEIYQARMKITEKS